MKKGFEIRINDNMISGCIDEIGTLSVIILHTDDATDVTMIGSDINTKIKWNKKDLCSEDEIKIKLIQTDNPECNHHIKNKNDYEMLEEYYQLKRLLQ